MRRAVLTAWARIWPASRFSGVMCLTVWGPQLIDTAIRGARAWTPSDPGNRVINAMLITWTVVFAVTLCHQALTERVFLRERAPRRPGEPIVGYRLWGQDDGRALRSWIQGTVWPIGAPMAAGTLYAVWYPGQADSLLRTTTPQLGQSVGVYALKLPPSAGYLRYKGRCVFGEVNLWGHVVEAEYGYRAQFAYPRRFIGGRTARHYAALYRVPSVSWLRWIGEQVWNSVKTCA